MPGRLNTLGLVAIDGRPTPFARGALALAILIAFGVGYALRPGGEEAAPRTGGAEASRALVTESTATTTRTVPRLGGAAALPALDRTPARARTAAVATPAPDAPAESTPASTSTSAPATPVTTPAPVATTAPPPAAAPPPARAPSRPTPPPAPPSESFDSSG